MTRKLTGLLLTGLFRAPKTPPVFESTIPATFALAVGQPVLLLDKRRLPSASEGLLPQLAVVNSDDVREATEVASRNSKGYSFDGVSQVVLPWQPPITGEVEALFADASGAEVNLNVLTSIELSAEEETNAMRLLSAADRVTEALHQLESSLMPRHTYLGLSFDQKRVEELRQVEEPPADSGASIRVGPDGKVSVVMNVNLPHCGPPPLEPPGPGHVFVNLIPSSLTTEAKESTGKAAQEFRDGVRQSRELVVEAKRAVELQRREVLAQAVASACTTIEDLIRERGFSVRSRPALSAATTDSVILPPELVFELKALLQMVPADSAPITQLGDDARHRITPKLRRIIADHGLPIEPFGKQLAATRCETVQN